MKRLLILLSCVLCAQSIFAQSTLSDKEEISRDTIANMVIVKHYDRDCHHPIWDIYFDNFSDHYADRVCTRTRRDSVVWPENWVDIFQNDKSERALNTGATCAMKSVKDIDILKILVDSTLINVEKWREVSGVIIPRYTLDRHSHLRRLQLRYYCEEDTITAADISRIAYAIDTRIVFGDWAAATADRERFDFLPYFDLGTDPTSPYALHGGLFCSSPNRVPAIRHNRRTRFDPIIRHFRPLFQEYVSNHEI